MANKLFLVCATLALCFLLINASSYRTIVQFDEGDDTTPTCRKEFQQEKHLLPCQKWLHRQARQGRGSGPSLDDDEFHFKRTILQKCCSELRKEDPVCVCPNLKQAAKAVRLQGQHSPFQATIILRLASRLPEICHTDVGDCPFGFPPSSPY